MPATKYELKPGQRLRLYGFYTDNQNWERYEITLDEDGALLVEAQAAGTGALRTKIETEQ